MEYINVENDNYTHIVLVICFLISSVFTGHTRNPKYQGFVRYYQNTVNKLNSKFEIKNERRQLSLVFSGFLRFFV